MTPSSDEKDRPTVTAADEATPELPARHRAASGDDWLTSAIPNRPGAATTVDGPREPQDQSPAAPAPEPIPSAPMEVRVEGDPSAPPLPKRRQLRAASRAATPTPPPAATVAAPQAAAPAPTAPVVEPVAETVAEPVLETVPAVVERQRIRRGGDLSGRSSAGGDASFFSGPSARPRAFNPGNLDPGRFGSNGYRGFAVSDAPAPRRRRNPAKTFIALGVVLLVAGGFAKWGAPVVWDEALKASRASVVSDLGEMSVAQASYRGLYGGYANDRGQLTTPETFNDVTILSASAGDYCLRGSGLIGPPVFMTSQGIVDTPCS